MRIAKFYSNINVFSSMVEIYQERVRDLLAHGSGRSLKVREHPTSGPYIHGELFLFTFKRLDI